MTIIKEATGLVQECEARIRSLIESALADRRYEEIPALAALAARLAQVLNGTSLPAAPKTIDESTADESVPAPKKERKGDYPRFERHQDRLVKIGWSKKERRAYEHRAPMSVVRAVVATLVSRMNKRGYIQMDEVLPIAFDGGEVPSYQAYLVVAWLRDLGVLSKQGNDGYRFDRKRVSDSDIDALLEQTSERE